MAALKGRKQTPYQVKEHSSNGDDHQDKIHVQKVRGDGNCFFRIISLYVHGTEEKHEDIRSKIANEIMSNPSEYE